jgi:ornithine--oxo-acid transaminase
LIIKSSGGSWFHDVKDNAFLDCTSSYGAVPFGYGYRPVIDELCRQLGESTLCPRILNNESLLNFGGIMQKCFANVISNNTYKNINILPSSTGVEAFESMVKIMRAHGNGNGRGNKIILASQFFHGRTLAAIALNNNDKFAPHCPGFILSQYNSMEDLRNIIERYDDICGVIVEPIQVEGGMNIATDKYLKGIRELTAKHGILYGVDEIQTGMFRTGDLTCSQDYNPDMIILGKGLGGGVCITSESIMDCIKPGDHGSTFGGNPLAMSIASYTVDHMHKNISKYHDNMYTVYHILHNMKNDINYIKGYNAIEEIRGTGMLYGIQFHPLLSAENIAQDLCDYGCITSITRKGTNTIRFTPNFNITKIEVQFFSDMLSHILCRLDTYN